MAETHFALESQQTSAETMRRFLSAIAAAARGVMSGFDELLEVVEASPQAAAVDVEAGAALVGLTTDLGFYLNTTDKNLTIAANSSGNGRIDTIVAELDLTQVAGSDTLAVKVVQGTPSGSPAAPTLTQTATQYQLPLADITVADGFTVITDSEITDRRVFTTPIQTDWTLLTKQADETVNNSSTLQDDDTFTFMLDANGIYHIRGKMIIASDAAADFKLQWNLPGTGTSDGVIFRTATPSAFTEAATVTVSGAGVAVKQFVAFEATILADTVGPAVLQWAQGAAQANDATHFDGSWMEYRKIN